MKTAESGERGRHIRHFGMFLPYAMQIAYGVLDWFPDLPGWITAIVFAAAIGTVLVVLKHTRELCDKCLGEMPLDPEEAVRRNRRQLRLMHHMKNFLIGGGVLMLISVALPKHWWEAHVVSNMITLCFCYWIFAAARHNRLQPWCPWCRDDGDEDEFEEIPDPTDDHSKPIPV